MSAWDGLQIEVDTTTFSTSLNIATRIRTLWALQHTDCPNSTQNSLSETQLVQSALLMRSPNLTSPYSIRQHPHLS